MRSRHHCPHFTEVDVRVHTGHCQPATQSVRGSGAGAACLPCGGYILPMVGACQKLAEGMWVVPTSSLWNSEATERTKGLWGLGSVSKCRAGLLPSVCLVQGEGGGQDFHPRLGIKGTWVEGRVCLGDWTWEN